MLSPDTIENSPKGLRKFLISGRLFEAQAMLQAISDPSQGHGFARSPGQPVDSWLHACARQGGYELTLEAARRSSDVDRPDSETGASPFLTALISSNLDAVLALLEAGCDVKARDRDGLGALHQAAFAGDVAMLNVALALAPEQLNEVSAGCQDMLEALGQAPEPDFDPDPERLRRPMHYESWGARPRGLLREELFENEGLAPIHCAVESSAPEAAVFLLACGASPSVFGQDGKTPLGTAAWMGNSLMVEALLKAGAPIDELDKSGRTALFWAAEQGRANCVQTLFAAGADLDAWAPARAGLNLKAKSAREAGERASSLEVQALFEAWNIKSSLRGMTAQGARPSRSL